MDQTNHSGGPVFVNSTTTVWLPHIEFANSPGNPEFNHSTKFGPFKDQVFISDFTKKNVLRVHLEKVGGQYQGAVFHFVRYLACGGFCLKFDASGQLWVGELSRGWSTGTPGVQVIRWDGKTVPYEMQAVRLTSSGFDVHMTRPIQAAMLDSTNVNVRSFKYKYWPLYGSEPSDEKTVALKNITVSKDHKTISLGMDLEEGRVYRIVLNQVVSQDGNPLLNDTACYTLNKLRGGEGS